MWYESRRFSPLLGLLVFLVSIVPAHARLLSQLGFMEKEEYLPDCTCNCCIGGLTTVKSQISGNNEVKCMVPPIVSSRRCVGTCKTSDSILATSIPDANGHIKVEYGRFCFYECKPMTCDTSAEVSCGPLAPAQVAAAKGGGGNGLEVDTGCR
eukprot:gnl/MRDRNA2_/MRDRNA2_151545_c0_seq1.p1 gnl/MRDRNA2_/MRDRNA2_151545_c0~~gnl/MRDRNA2_/MRDRNA2_151545_c0_seq1.p1  ORF type:complete len:153 (+),score=11.90 gnl/MRDRNA2_/MRDRNA2_151545_c0_seq1:107-565(+)